MNRIVKTGFVATVLALFTMAVTADVTSVNVVGFLNVEFQPGFNFVGHNWETMDGSDEIAIQNIFADASALTAGFSLTTSDKISLWTGTGYLTYWYQAYDADEFPEGPAWTRAGQFVPTVDVIFLGEGFWFNKVGASVSTNQFVGQVRNMSSPFVHVIESGFNMISSSWPADAALNDNDRWDWSNAAASSSLTTSDKISVWTGTGYVTYWYQAYDADEFPEGPAWTRAGQFVPTADHIPAGAGVWYNRYGVGTTIDELL